MKNKIKGMMVTIASVGCLAGITGCDNYKGLTVNFWHTFGKGVSDAVTLRAKEFSKLIKENEGVDVRIKMTYKGGYDDVKGEVSKNFAIGDNPTLTVAYPDHVADYFSAEQTPGEYVVNMADLVNDSNIGFGKEDWLGDTEGVDDFVSSFWQESTSYTREGVYSIPFLKSTESMLYNFDLVKSAIQVIGGEYEDLVTDDDIKEFMSNLTWEEFMNFCESIVDNKNAISPSLLWPAFYDSDANLFISQMYQRGIPYSSINQTTGMAQIDFNGISGDSTPAQITAYNDTVEMLKKFKNWYDKGLFQTKGVDGKYSSSYFVSGKAMFAIGSTGGSGYSFPSTDEFTVQACKVPFTNNNPLYVSQGVTLCLLNNSKLIKTGKNSEAVKYGFKFIKYLTNPKVNSILCINNSEGYMPVRESAYTTAEFTRFLTTQTEYVKVANVIVHDIDGKYLNSPVFKGSATLRDQCGGLMADVFKLGTKPSDTQIKTILDRAIQQTILKM